MKARPLSVLVVDDDAATRVGLARELDALGFRCATAADGLEAAELLGECTFDVVLSSHVIEHQPDLVAHLNAVERLLVPGGFYFLLIPDKNYCFDHFIAESTIADIVDAHHSRRKIHTLRSQIEHAALATHNNSRRHWSGDHGMLLDVKERVMRAIAQYEQAPDDYVDVHAWYFSPATFRQNINLLRG